MPALGFFLSLGNFVNLQANTVIQYFNDKELNKEATRISSISSPARLGGSRSSNGYRGNQGNTVTKYDSVAANVSERSSRSKQILKIETRPALSGPKAEEEHTQSARQGSKQSQKETANTKAGNSKSQRDVPINSSKFSARSSDKQPRKRNVRIANIEEQKRSTDEVKVAMISKGNEHFHYETWHEKKTIEICGTDWQEKYKELHAEILNRNREEKYLVYLCPGTRQGCCGYGNRLRAVASLFYLAVLTDRAFLIDWRAPEPIENHLTPRNIQWNYSAPTDICTGLRIRKHYWGTTKTDIREAEGWIIKESRHFKKWLTSTDLKSYFDWPVEEITTIWYFAEGGITLNPFLMKRAKDLGVTPLLSNTPSYTRIGCAFDFLFSKSESLENGLTQLKEELQFDEGPVIGIHIRTGDDQFDYYASDNDRTWNLKNVSRLLKFFDCAKAVEKKMYNATERSRVRWFVSTDHVRVRKFSTDSYPRKVVTSNLPIQHLDILFNTTVLNFTAECNYTDASNTTMVCYNVEIFNVSDYCANRSNASASAENNTTVNGTGPFTQGIRAMLIDHLMLAESDFLILCDSSFGSTAVGLSMRGTDSYTLGDQGCEDLVSARKKTKLRFFGR